MRVVISAPAKYHFFDLGRQLAQRGVLAVLMTGYPLFKLKNETALAPYIQSHPLFHIVYRVFLNSLGKDLEYWDKTYFDDVVSRRMPKCDVFMGIAASCYKSSLAARSLGASVVVDRPCSHIEVQDRLLQDEAKREGIPLKPIDPRVVEREILEYETCDAITVPSNFAARSFYEKGFSRDKIRIIPYGASLDVFHPDGSPPEGEFRVLYVGQLSVRKGVVHLIRAFERVQHPRKRLVLVGANPGEIATQVRDAAARLPIDVLGHVPQPDLKRHMSTCHVFVLPSIEDGYGLVLNQAMACGAPIVATHNTGADMVITEGQEGLLVPAADDDALTDRLQRLADDPDLRDAMGRAALARAQGIAGWDDYGGAVMDMFQSLRS